MAYMHIDNLYKNQEVLLFKECYAMEKIHGTSAHIRSKREESETIFVKKIKNNLSFSSGG